jgi:hypothetical protein
MLNCVVRRESGVRYRIVLSAGNLVFAAEFMWSAGNKGFAAELCWPQQIRCVYGEL